MTTLTEMTIFKGIKLNSREEFANSKFYWKCKIDTFKSKTKIPLLKSRVDVKYKLQNTKNTKISQKKLKKRFKKTEKQLNSHLKVTNTNTII